MMWSGKGGTTGFAALVHSRSVIRTPGKDCSVWQQLQWVSRLLTWTSGTGKCTEIVSSLVIRFITLFSVSMKKRGRAPFWSVKRDAFLLDWWKFLVCDFPCLLHEHFSPFTLFSNQQNEQQQLSGFEHLGFCLTNLNFPEGKMENIQQSPIAKQWPLLLA